MSNKSVLGAPSTTHKRNSTAFNVGRDFTFTAAPGMLLPVYRKFLNIGEKVKGNPKFFLRTNPLLAPSMTDIDVYVDTFFVPMRHIFSMFDQWLTQVDDNNSDMFTSEGWRKQLPVLGHNNVTEPFTWMNSSIFDTRIYHGYNDYQNAANHVFGFDLHRLTMHLGYNPQSIFINCSDASSARDYDGIIDDYSTRRVVQNRNSPAISPFFYAAYQKIYMDVYRDSEFEHNNVKSYNMDYAMNDGSYIIDPTENMAGGSPSWYDSTNRMGLLQLRYRNRNKDYFTAIHPKPVFNSIGFISDADDVAANVKSWLMSSNDSVAMSDSEGLSLEVSRAHSDGLTSTDSGRWLAVGSSLGDGSSVFTSSIQNLYAQGVGSLSHDHSFSFSVEQNIASLRTAFAIDKLLRTMNNAGRHVDDQLFALFGVKLPKGIDNEVYRIKSYHTMVHLGEVVSTAQTQITDGESTEVTPLGEMAGRGVAVLNSDDSFTFTAPCHGIIMSIFSIAPRYKYIGAVEKDGFRMYLEDFYKPQLDNLGKQPFFAYELGYTNNELTDMTQRLGWQYYNMQDKISFDKASLAFITNGNAPWAFCTTAPYYNPSSTFKYQYSFNKVSPSDLNNIFVAEYDGQGIYPKDGTEGADSSRLNYCQFPTYYLRDPFKVDFHMNMTFFSEMSRFGEPTLGGI